VKLPAFCEPIVFGLLLSGLMSLVVSGIATWNALGFAPDLVVQWMKSWMFAWAVAFPSVLVVAPAVRRITRSMVASSPPVAPVASGPVTSVQAR
jgi:hypothetical protein